MRPRRRSGRTRASAGTSAARPAHPPDGPGMTHVDDARPGLGSPVSRGHEHLSHRQRRGRHHHRRRPDGGSPVHRPERTKVVAEVQEGLTWLGTRRRPGGRQLRLRHPAPSGIERAPGPDQDRLRAARGALARSGHDQARLRAATCSASTSTSRRSARNLGTKWAYVGFFTKYPTEHFAYALKPQARHAVRNDGWGPDNIDRVFTHETGHIFGCPDEYAVERLQLRRPSSATCASRTATARTARRRSSTA